MKTLILLTIITASHALTVSFGEFDLSAAERDGHASVSVTKTGRSRGNITCTLIPLTLEQAFLQYGHQISGEPDPAEIDKDFSPALTEHVFEPGTETIDRLLPIQVVDDNVLENEEVFWVRLNISFTDPVDEGELQEDGRQFLLIRIKADSRDVSVVKAVLLNQTISEAAGVVDDFITIFREGESEVPLSFKVEVVDVGSGVTAVKGEDYELQTGQYTLQPTAKENITIALRIIDDKVAEGAQMFNIWSLSQAEQNAESFEVTIIDNDVVVVRVGNTTEMIVEEGGSVTLCAEIESPVEITRNIFIIGQLIPGTAKAPTDYDPFGAPVYDLHGSTNRRSCQEIRTKEDDISELTEQFSLSLSHFQADGLVRLEPDTFTFLLTDNDVPHVQVELFDNSSTSEDVILTEESGTVDEFIRIYVPGPFSIAAQFLVSVSSDSAERGKDFQALTGNFTLVPGNSSVFLPVTVLEDDYVEYDERWTVTISQPDTSFPPMHISFIIADNDRVTVGFVNDSVVRVGEGEVVRLCASLSDVDPFFLQREIVLEGHTVPETADEGSDYEAVSWNFTFSSSTGLACVEVAITDDSVPELMETFTVTIQPINSSALISIQPSAITISINNDDVPQLVVEIVGASSNTTSIIQEGDGTLNNFIRIFPSGAHPFPLEYHVSVTSSSSDDFSVVSGTFTFLPSDNERFLPITVNDDDVAEDDEQFSLVVMISGQRHVLNFIIRDNDDVKVGFVDDSEVTVEEGQSITVCVKIHSPKTVDRTIHLLARTFPLTAVAGEDYTALAIGLQLNGSQRMTCFNVSTLGNEKPEHSQDFTIQVDVNSPAIRLGPDVLTVKILDDDGTPLAPVITEVKLLKGSSDDKSYNLFFTWETKQEELRPITSFSGTITLSNPVEKAGVNIEEDKDDIHSQLPFSVDNSTTEYTEIDVPLAGRYTVEVCSNNSFGLNCSVPATYNSNVAFLKVKTGKGGNEIGLPAVVIAVIVVLVIAVLLCCGLFIWFLLIIFCCYCEDWRSYHPEKTEKKHEKDFKSYRDMQHKQEEESDFDSDEEDEV